MSHKLKHALVTGGTGFLGQHLVRRLIEDGARVTVISRSADKLTPLTAEHGARLSARACDFDDASTLAELSGIDCVFHLAACTDTGATEAQLQAVNVTRSAALLRWAIEAGVPRFFHASSIEAQGPTPPEQGPASEADDCAPLGAYGRTKRAAELLLLREVAGTRTGLLIGRIGNVYGPGGPTFVRALARAVLDRTRLLEEPLLERARLQPLYVSDFATLARSLASSDAQGICNMVGEQTITPRQWLGDIAELCGIQLPPQGTARMSAREHGLADYLFAARPRIQRVYCRALLTQHHPEPLGFDMLKGSAYSLAALPERSAS